ncbi:hypothetical protein CHS0354_023794 [Potamilus streckersoni]|uniref:transketolase n=1 Tax=Potamilus streckersoni TaxID=2493646 RepID=A0AAE0VMK9_9BIVA|nr:hypothetical protein CHS0354_023794 [Potamilus streckersoni]
MSVTKSQLANSLRFLSVDAIEKANSGHPGLPLGMADVATVLFTKFLRFYPKDPHWFNRDRFVLSAGHGSMLLYSLLYVLGYEDFSIEQIKSFRQFGSFAAGHPEFGHGRGIETTTGPLGQGLANAVGMALSEKKLSAHYGSELINHKTFVIVGDGCLMEGISHEAVGLAGHLNLSKLIVLFDDNGISIDGKTSLTTSENTKMRFEASGWNYISCDGHDYDDVARALTLAIDPQSNSPTLVACRTIIGYGATNKQGTEKVHGAPLGKNEIDAMRKLLGWHSPPFDIPPDILNTWRSIGTSHFMEYQNWLERLDTSPHKAEILNTRFNRHFVPNLDHEIMKFKTVIAKETPGYATRKSSFEVLNALTSGNSFFLGGSADLTSSNLTKSSSQKAISSDDFSGNYIYYGVREHAMGAIMNGIALHGGFIPYGGTFLVFSDYIRPAIRLSALMGLRVIYVMTHDSIGLGEDGPTHQPIEHLASLRAIPNLLVFRPCDSIETAECWQIAISQTYRPSILALSRQNNPDLATRSFPTEQSLSTNLSLHGGYILGGYSPQPDFTIIATGSEVSLAVAVADALIKDKLRVNVVSMPCLELFNEQPPDYRTYVIPTHGTRVIIEAGIELPWQALLRENDFFFGINSFGASAPAHILYKHFGLTVQNILNRIMTLAVHKYEDPKLVVVHRGQNYKSIVDELYLQGIIKYRFPMYFLGKLLSEVKQIKPGRYYVPPNLSPAEIIKFMASRKQDNVEIKVPDAIHGTALAKLFSSHLDIDSLSFMSAFGDTNLLTKYNIKAKNFEGYFTPNTYKLQWAITAPDIIDYFVTQFKSFYTDSLQQRAKELGISETELLTLASIIDAETDDDNEFSTISSVYWNRLKIGRKLQADPTVLFAIGKGNKRVLYKDLLFDSPYNTYIHKGLPPGPILSPSFKAIIATLYPKKTNFIYFVATGDGKHRFATDEIGHEKNVRLYRNTIRKHRLESIRK